ncbi:MAG: ribonuclease HIII [candidate division Zixibacteria bacterium]
MRIIGVDESGKGDFFGPLVIAAFVCDDDQIDRLLEMGVRDSKKITDNRILSIADDLMTRFEYAEVVIGPEKYNSLYSKIKNLNHLLAWGHARAIENLLGETKADRVITDKFANSKVLESALMEKSQALEVRQMVRGEVIPQVAAASIIARAAFVRQMKSLASKYGMELPKGASAAVDEAGRQLVAKYSVDVLKLTAKTHFKNYQRATVVQQKL